MDLRELLEDNNGEISFEVSEKTDAQIKDLWKICEGLGLKFDRIEQRYNSCIFHIFTT